MTSYNESLNLLHPALPPLTPIPSQRQHLEIREATQADNPALLELTRSAPMKGRIRLRIDRDPDFFALQRLRGEGKTLIAIRGEEVIGCISAAVRMAYVSGVAESVAYVGDMKVHPQVAGSRTALRLIQSGVAYLKSIGLDLCFSVVAAGNLPAMSLFEGRLGLPQGARLGRFIVSELVPSPFDSPSGKYSIRPAEVSDLPAITSLVDNFHRSRQFAPRLLQNDLASLFFDGGQNTASMLFVACSGGRIVAVLGLHDTYDVKRNVLLDAPVPLRCALDLLRIVTAPFPGFSVPRMGNSVRVLYVRYAACEEDHRNSLRALIARARAVAFEGRFTFLVIGLHERDPLGSVVRGIPRLTFSSLGLAVSLTDPGRIESLMNGIPYEDFALV
jgi:predicted N-acetyltransferase YhbS